MTDHIRIVEVGPRDGLQNEKLQVPTDLKIRFIEALAAAGLREIEATSFVSPKRVPQLADAEALWPMLSHGPAFSALTPNLKGLERAISLDVDRIAVFTAASETFTQKNINMSIDQSIETFAEMISIFRASRPTGFVRGYVSTAFECPYEGRIDPGQTVRVIEKLLNLGVDEVSIGDTIGVAAPPEVKSLTRLVLNVMSRGKITYHFHDTNGTAIANVAEAMEMGIESFDSSAGGLGGCPFAPGAGGNLATEDLVYFLERCGIPTHVDLYRLATSSLEILKVLGRSPCAKGQLARLSLSGTSPT